MIAKPKIFFIVGPTATRKTDIAIWIAKRIGGEIVSADSMLVYRGMDIGTAKPSQKLRRRIKHHLIDILPPGKNFSVFDFRTRALRVISEILKRKKIPIVVGGSGLYVRALLRGLTEQPGAHLEFRKKLEKRIEDGELSKLYEELCAQDPVRASEIKPGDSRRIIRALEISHHASQPPSQLRGGEISLQALGFDPRIVGVTKERSELYRDIEKRVDKMFRLGLLKEIQMLSKEPMSKTAMQAVGYKEILEVLRRGGSLEEAKERIKINTRHLAKRQWTWFKRESGLDWVQWRTSEKLSSMAKRVLEALNSSKE